ncbi:hypothetical protein [Arenicella xantha]|nr:hypothetical protein [Arenicella xantha]
MSMTAVLALVASNGANAAVDSMSLESFIEADAPYWEVSVVCENVDTPKLMRKPIAGNQWCSVESPSMCDENKYSISRQMCDDSSASAVADEAENSSAAAAPKATEQVSSEPAPAPVAADTTAPVEQSPKESVSTEPPTRAELMREQLQIEEQRILIEQKRLELQGLELELKKQNMGT